MSIKPDDFVKCAANQAFRHPFVGRVMKLYERSALVEIVEHHQADRWKALELTHRTVVAFKNLELVPVTR